MPMEYIVPSLRIVAFRNMAVLDIMEEHLAHLVTLEEDQFITNFHQQLQKAREKYWLDQKIRLEVFKEKELVFLYDNQFVCHPGKFHKHWWGPYIVKEITDGGAVHLAMLRRDYLPGYVNGSRLKPYRDNPVPTK